MLEPAHAQETQPLDATLRTAPQMPSSADCCLGAFTGGRLAGVLAFAPDDEPGQFIVRVLAVHPEHQRRGLARALMLEALRLGGGRAFAVATGAHNAPALALYHGLGFEPYRWGSLGPGALALVKLRRLPTCPEGPP